MSNVFIHMNSSLFHLVIEVQECVFGGGCVGSRGVRENVSSAGVAAMWGEAVLIGRCFSQSCRVVPPSVPADV